MNVRDRFNLRAAPCIEGVSGQTNACYSKKVDSSKSMSYMLNLAFLFTEPLIKLYAICKSGFGT